MRPPVSSRAATLLAAFLIAVTVFVASPPGVSAHTFTRNDANDSASKIDLRSVSVTHTSTSLVHSVRTWNSWTPASLQHDSFFLIGINKDNDAAYERCAFIYYTNRLRGQLSNCGSQFIRYLTVSKVNATTAKITIPRNQVGPAYEWYGGSFWVGARPCRNVCRDFAPNNLPDILHDLKPPVATLEATTDIRVWEGSTSTTFSFPFSVSDTHSGVDSWRVQRRQSGTWSNVVSGAGDGSFNPDLDGTEGAQDFYRVRAVDEQGNIDFSLLRQVLIPLDDDNLGPAGTFSNPTSQQDAAAFGGYYQVSDLGETFTFDAVTGGGCREFALIGPGGGDWTVDVSRNGVPEVQIVAPVAVGPRQVLYSDTLCLDALFEFEVTGGSGFGVDAVLI